MPNLDLIDTAKLQSTSLELRRSDVSPDLKIFPGLKIVLASKELLHDSFVEYRGEDVSTTPIVSTQFSVERLVFEIRDITEQTITLNFIEKQRMVCLKPITLVLGFVRPRMIRKILELSSVLPIREIYIYFSDYSDPSYLLSSEYGAYTVQQRQIYSLRQSSIPYLPTIKLFSNKKQFNSDMLPRLAGSLVLGDSMSSFSIEKLLSCTETGDARKDHEGYTLFIGPERGFSPMEREIFCEQGVISVNIGAEIYQVDTAVVSLCSQLSLIHKLKMKS